MNLLAFLFIVACGTLIALCIILEDEAKDIARAIAERIRNPRLTRLEELHRHWEEQDKRFPWDEGKDIDA